MGRWIWGLWSALAGAALLALILISASPAPGLGERIDLDRPGMTIQPTGTIAPTPTQTPTQTPTETPTPTKTPATTEVVKPNPKPPVRIPAQPVDDDEWDDDDWDDDGGDDD